MYESFGGILQLMEAVRRADEGKNICSLLMFLIAIGMLDIRKPGLKRHHGC